MIARLLVYIFPLFLIVLEWIFRSAINTDSQEFIGPTLAAVGASLVLPVTVPKKQELQLSPEVQQDLRLAGVVIRSNADTALVSVAWLCVLIATSFWMFSVYASSSHLKQTFWYLPLPYWLGFANCLIGIVLSEIKEFV